MPPAAKNPFFDAGSQENLRERLQANGRRLSGRDAQVLMLRGGLIDHRHYSHAEIAQRFNLSTRRIRQIEATALVALQQQPDTGPSIAIASADESTPRQEDDLGFCFEDRSVIGEVIPLITPGVPLTLTQARSMLFLRIVRGDRLGDLIDRWLRRLKSKHSRNAYRRDLMQYFDYCISRDLDPVKVRIQDFIPYGDWLLQQTTPRGTRYKKWTRKRKIDVAGSFYKFLVDVDAIDRSPVTHDGRIHGKPSPRDKSLTPEQTEIIYADAASGHRTMGARCALLAVKLLYTLGIRVSELCNLDLDELTETEHDGYVIRGIRFVAKGDEDQDRGIPREVDEHYLAPYLAERPTPATAEDGRALLLTLDGRRLSRHQVSGLIERPYRRGLLTRKATPHSARHTFKVRGLEAGFSMEQLRVALGHKSLETTQNYGLTRNHVLNDPSHAVAAGQTRTAPATGDP